MGLSIHNDAFQSVTGYTEKVKQAMHASGSALVIMKDNQIVHEWYSGTHHFAKGARNIDAASQFNVYSTRVTYIGLAAAIAVHEGHIGLDDHLSDYFAELDKDLLNETTIRHLLTRCTGLKIIGQTVQRVFESGTNIEGKRPDLVAEIICRATGKTVNEILTERVFTPLNWTNTEWVTEGKSQLVCDIHSPDTHPTLRIGSNLGNERNLYVSARELAYWGNLHLNKGVYKGKQMVPTEVFDLAACIQSPKTVPDQLPKFGFFWWIKAGDNSYEWNELSSALPEGSYQILGASGCSCTVMPELNVVAVRMYNSLYSHEGSDYIKDIQTFGDLVVSGLKKL